MKEIEQIFVNDFQGKCDMCGVCCTHVSINSTLPDGSKFEKPAGQRCGYLTDDNLCGVWGNEGIQPEVCRTIKPMNSLCRFDLRQESNGQQKHIIYLEQIETLTKPE